MAKIGYGIRSSHGTSGSRGMCGPLSMCQKRPPWSLSGSGCHHAVLAITWQSSPRSGSMARWQTALRLSIS